MNELSIEEKAKRYDEALERAKKYKLKEDLIITQDIFPELKESEDEKVRKAIINVFATHKDYEIFFDVSVEDILAWLEKHGEQNLVNSAKTCKDEQIPAWSEEDEEMLNQVIEDIVKLAGPYVCYHKDVDWLKSIKYRVQPKQEWSEEDEKMLRDIINDFSEELDEWTDKEEIEIITNKISFLKSLESHPIHPAK